MVRASVSPLTCNLPDVRESSSSSSVDEISDESQSQSASEDDEASECLPVQLQSETEICVGMCRELVPTSIASSKKDEIVTTSYNGEAIVQLLCLLLLPMTNIAFNAFASTLVEELECCFRANYIHQTLVLLVGQLWQSYHRARFSSTIQSVWQAVLREIQVNVDMTKVEHHVMQLVIDRTFKAMIAERTKSKSEKGPRRMPSAALPLSMHERNAVRYMAGYVILKLKNKFSKKLALRRENGS